MLIPSRTDTRWFHEWVYGKAELRFVKGRLRFNDSKGSAPFPSLVVVYRGATHDEKLPHAQLSTDLISRQAAIDALHMHLMYRMGTDNNKKRLDDWINSLPSAQPETAKRIVGKSKDGMTLWYQCDMCNEPVDAQDNFCRGCGRRLTDG